MDRHVEPYRICFQSHSHDSTYLAIDYIKGLVRTDRGKRNIERMVEQNPDADYQSAQQFVTDSPWDHAAVFKMVGQEASELLNRNGWLDTALMLDETGHKKKGRSSVGVARQYSGTVGKVDNCQVSVHATLVNADGDSCLIDTRLFLPEKWAQDEARCIKAGIPEWNRMHMTKPQLAFEMVCEAIAAGIKFAWVGGDGLYGDNSELCNSLDQIGVTFMLDIHCNQHIWLERPDDRDTAVRVDIYAANLAPEKWTEVFIREATKGALTATAHSVRVWVWPPSDDAPSERTLILRRTPGEDTTKYALTNAQNDSLSLQKMVFMQAQRYWIERSFQDAKSEMGMSDYQVRKWAAWHHHMALTMMGMLFLLKERINFRKEYPMVSMHDLRLLMQAMIDGDDQLLERRLSQMDVRHVQREKSIDWHRRRQQAKKKLSTKK